MLVLSRRVNEEILIDENIRIQVIEVRGNRVRIGISAPDDVRILRSELEVFSSAVESPAGGVSTEVHESPLPYRMAHAG